MTHIKDSSSSSSVEMSTEPKKWHGASPQDGLEGEEKNDRHFSNSFSEASPLSRKSGTRKGDLLSFSSRSPRDLKITAKKHDRVKGSPNFGINWGEAIVSVWLFTLSYVLEVVRFALLVLRKPLSLILVGYLLALFISHLRATIGAALYPAVALLCHMPGISRLSFCHIRNTLPSVAAVQQPDYPSLVNIQSTTFERLLDDSVGGASLAVDIKKAEIATVDLITLVKISGLTNKERMAGTLNTFVEDAKRTGRGLQRYSAKVGGAVDRIMAVNDYALKRIEATASETWHPSLWISMLSPFSIQPSYSRALTTSFKQAMSTLETELHMLILAAEASIHDLDVLEEQLNLIHSMTILEDDSLSSSKHELLAKLWTIVGGNRAELRRYDTHQKLLSGLTEYRKKALAHVVGALHTLQTMSANLEALRERVSQPLLSPSTAIPLEVHVKSIRAGLERLAEGRVKAKKIEDARYAKLTDAIST